MRNLLGSGWFMMLHARFAYLSVLFVSSKSLSLGEMHVMSAVSELPPSESCITFYAGDTSLHCMAPMPSHSSGAQSKSISSLCSKMG